MSTHESQTQESSDLPLNDFQRQLVRCVGNLSGKVKYCGLNAFAHLRKAWAIRRIDPAMAAFRAITAEEEAASALLLSLQQKRYPGAGRLNHRLHLHKAAATPFLNAVAKVVATIEFVRPEIRLRDSTPPRVDILFDARRFGVNTAEPLIGRPDEPLNFRVAAEGSHDAHMFENELQEIAQAGGVEQIREFMEREANTRNLLLYASDEGIPAVDIPDGFLTERLRRATVLLVITIAVQQTPMHQLFAIQCLRAFLLALRAVEVPQLELESPPPGSNFLLEVIKDAGADPTANIKWRSNVPFTATFSFGWPSGYA